MAFATGTLSFRRFAVVGTSPATPDQGLLDKLAEFSFRASDLGAPEEVEYGWSGGGHVLDGEFSFDHNVFNDAAHFGLRIDTNKIPGTLKKSWQAMEETGLAKTNPSGFISKSQKRDAKEAVRKKCDEELRAGKFRRSKMVPVLWDTAQGMVYSPASGATFEKLAEIFERTFGAALEPITSGSLAGRLLESKGETRAFEDLRPTLFVAGPEGESQSPDYPWVAKGGHSKDFIGNEFFLWLWHVADAGSGVVKTDAGEVTPYIDKSIELDCAYGQTGKDRLHGDAPSRMPEARDALRSGKLPRSVGLILDANRQQFAFKWSAETLAVSGGRLPDVDEADTARVLFEERVGMLRDFCRDMDALFAAFLSHRMNGWAGRIADIRRWIAKAS